MYLINLWKHTSDDKSQVKSFSLEVNGKRVMKITLVENYETEFPRDPGV